MSFILSFLIRHNFLLKIDSLSPHYLLIQNDRFESFVNSTIGLRALLIRIYLKRISTDLYESASLRALLIRIYLKPQTSTIAGAYMMVRFHLIVSLRNYLFKLLFLCYCTTDAFI